MDTEFDQQMDENKEEIQNILDEFNLTDTLNLLKDGVKQGIFKKNAYILWNKFVPAVYNKISTVNITADEQMLQTILLQPLELFLADTSTMEDAEKVFKKLKDSDQPPKLCGKVFKGGEPTYSCNDCGLDTTCVLCIECFKGSTHKDHRYRINTSKGGGYCDCGDVEAWKKDPYCKHHTASLSDNAGQEAADRIPADMKSRFTRLFHTLLEYVANMLCIDKMDPRQISSQMELYDLSSSINESIYVTMLYNDELHTYDQVITTLEKAVECTHKQAIDYATIVDREGRCIVKYGDIVSCQLVMSVISITSERLSNRPIVVKVIKTPVLAHQNFAVRLLTWMEQLISKSDGLREMFCNVSLASNLTIIPKAPCVIETILLADSDLWKNARIHTSQLFMSAFLKDQESKKQFAVLFSRLYPALMRNYINDDHEHTVCACSNSVQIFTVPTLARMLIVDYNLFEEIMNDFQGYCNLRIGERGVFFFDRNQQNIQDFRRAQTMLLDIKYLLSARPTEDEWDDKLRCRFLNGFTAQVKLLNCMQFMDMIKRQTSQHIEFEPEWENAFNLQIKLQDNIAITQDWVSTDTSVLLDATIIVLNKCPRGMWRTKEVSVFEWTTDCVDYNVSEEFISIHVPVNRMLAAMFANLNKRRIPFSEIFKEEWVIHDDLKTVISQPWHNITFKEIIEPCLQSQVLVAQSQAQMWRRNGFSLLNQIYFYLNVRCQSEMLDKDILMLQTGAVMIDQDTFLIHLINKFGLTNWAKEDYDNVIKKSEIKDDVKEDRIKQIIILAEELFRLIIILIGERFSIGVGDIQYEDIVQREIIHQLCIEPLTHSELIKRIPENPYKESIDHIDDIIKEVATFKRSTSRGLYELKAASYAVYNPYFYHYSRSDQSTSEQYQKKRKADLKIQQCLTPPKLPAFVGEYKKLPYLLSCDLFIKLISLIMKRAVAKRSRSISEVQLERVLFLICMGLNEEEHRYNMKMSKFTFIEKMFAVLPNDELNLGSLLTELYNNYETSTKELKELIIFTYNNTNTIRTLISGNTEGASCKESGSTSLGKESEIAKEKKRRSEIAERRRKKLLAQMQKQQKLFISENTELFHSTSTDLDKPSESMEVEDPVVISNPIALGPNKTIPTDLKLRTATCILCQDSQEIRHDNRAMVHTTYIHRSTVLSKDHSHKFTEDPETYDPLFQKAGMFIGPHTSTCGHIMHYDCWQGFFDSILLKERRRTMRFRQQASYSVDKGEFLCPLCQTICNSTLPIIPPLPILLKNCKEEVDLSLNDWLDGLQKTITNSIQEKMSSEQTEDFLYITCPLSSVSKMLADSVSKNFQLLFDFVYDDSSGHFSDSISDILKKFSTEVYSIGLGVPQEDDNIRVPVMAWGTCAFTISAIEQYLLSIKKPLFSDLSIRLKDCLTSLVRFSAVCSQVIKVDVVRKHCMDIISCLLCVHDEAHKFKTPTILEIDMFDYLVKISLSLPTLYTSATYSVPVEINNVGNKILQGMRSSVNEVTHMVRSHHSIANRLTAPSAPSAPSGSLGMPSYLRPSPTAMANMLATTGSTGGSPSTPVTMVPQPQTTPPPVQRKLNRVATGGLNELHCLLVVYAAKVTQVMLQTDTDAIAIMETEDAITDEDEQLLAIFIKMRRMTGILTKMLPHPVHLRIFIQNQTISFLRQVAIFFHFLTEVKPPVSLTENNDGEYTELCKYLAIPVNISAFFKQGELMDSLFESWCRDIRKAKDVTLTIPLTLVPLKPKTLIKLPKYYIELMDEVSTFTCPRHSGEDSRAPALCLICSEMICSQSYCCQAEINKNIVGAATAHAYHCGGGVGIFLRVRECHVLMLFNRTKGGFIAAPYLDDYGETDQGLRRGNPLHLSEERYENLVKIWSGHSVPEEITHLLEGNNNLMSIEWQHL